MRRWSNPDRSGRVTWYASSERSRLQLFFPLVSNGWALRLLREEEGVPSPWQAFRHFARKRLNCVCPLGRTFLCHSIDRGIAWGSSLPIACERSCQIWGGNRLAAFGKTQGRRQVWSYGGVRELGRVRGQALGGHVRGPDGAGGTRWGQTRWIRHLLRISAPGR